MISVPKRNLLNFEPIEKSWIGVGGGWGGREITGWRINKTDGELLRGTRLDCPTFAGLLSLSLHRKARVITVLRLFYMKSNITDKGRQV